MCKERDVFLSSDFAEHGQKGYVTLKTVPKQQIGHESSFQVRKSGDLLTVLSTSSMPLFQTLRKTWSQRLLGVVQSHVYLLGKIFSWGTQSITAFQLWCKLFCSLCNEHPHVYWNVLVEHYLNSMSAFILGEPLMHWFGYYRSVWMKLIFCLLPSQY